MPSAANFAQREAKRLGSLTFFLDYQIGRFVVAEALRAAGAKVEVHFDHFDQAAPDVEWIPEVGRRDWVLITKDEHIRRNPRGAARACGPLADPESQTAGRSGEFKEASRREEDALMQQHGG